MKSRRFTPIELSWPQTPDFTQVAAGLVDAAKDRILASIWAGYEDMRTTVVEVGVGMEDIERSLTQILQLRVSAKLSGWAAFQCQHGYYEQETRRPAPAQPPQYDIAFVFTANPRIAWPVEAKVMRTSDAIGAYVTDVREQFLTCRYAPFTASGAMVGYLLAGDTDRALQNVATALNTQMRAQPHTDDSRHGVTAHIRHVPEGKPYPGSFECHHLIMFIGVY